MRLHPLTAWQAVVVLLVFGALQAAYATTLPLSGDEAYYWVWSHTLQAGYYDHPPAIAVLIALSTALFGDTVLGVRMVAVLCMAGAAFAIFMTARAAFGPRTATLALILALLLPATEVGFTLATPDSPLLLFWAMGLFFVRKAVVGPGRWRDFLLAGLMIGLAMDSKYTAVLLPAAIMGFLALRRRHLLLSLRTWAAAALAFAAFVPVLWWNVTHGMESFIFQYHHGVAGTWTVRWPLFAAFLGGQMLILSPIFFGILVATASGWHRWRSMDDDRLFLAVCFLFPGIFFLYLSLFSKIQLNWTIPIYVSTIPLLADFILARRLVRTTLAGAIVAVAMTLAIKWPVAFGLWDKLNPQNRLFGPDVAAVAVESLRRPGDAVFADDLQRASVLSFRLPDHPRVYIPTPERFSEFTRWDANVDFASMHGLYLSVSDRSEALLKVFNCAALVKTVVAEKPGFRPEKYFIYRVGTNRVPRPSQSTPSSSHSLATATP